jgi:acetyltransferase-like isoleucine patch superfamily enzyme
MSVPGGKSMRISLHRLRGVQIGQGVWIGQQVLIETAFPNMIRIGDRVVIGIRATILAHFQDIFGVTIKNDVYIGAGALILPGVTIGEGAVVSAGSVVTTSVPPMTVVQGNPAKRIAKCGIPLGISTPRLDFVRQLRKLNERIPEAT